MTLTLCAAIMQTVLLAAPTDGDETYSEARRKVLESGKPMVVMVGTDWCGPCQSMKKNVLPRLRERGLFKKVEFAQVNADHDKELAKEITGGGPVPQLVIFRRTDRGWLRHKLIGGQTVEKVEQFIKEELASDEVENKTDKNTSGKDSEIPENSVNPPDKQHG